MNDISSPALSLSGWPAPTAASGRVFLDLDGQRAEGEEPVAHDVSAAARIGDTLFLAADECAHVEVLHRVSDHRFGEHQRIVLSDVFSLPEDDEEMDVEGLSIDDGWLWIVGSHSLTRKKPKRSKPIDAQAIARMARLKDNHNRMFLGRLRLRQADGERWTVDPASAEMLPVGKHDNKLLRELEADPLFAPFLALPAKENGLDVEGLAASDERVWLGCRGPVINTWACVFEFDVAPHAHGKLKIAGEVRKRWLDLGGLGVRDMKRRGDDLLILAGPTMAISGPSRLYRWRNWRASPPEDRLLETPELLAWLPFGAGCDHPEAIAPWGAGEGGLLVVCDSPAPSRLRSEGILADVFRYGDLGL